MIMSKVGGHGRVAEVVALVRLVIHQETMRQIPDNLLEYLMVVMAVLDYNMISRELIHIMLVVGGRYS